MVYTQIMDNINYDYELEKQYHPENFETEEGGDKYVEQPQEE